MGSMYEITVQGDGTEDGQYRAYEAALSSYRHERDKLVTALANAFPHFGNGEPVTADAIAKIGHEYQDMVMNWAPTQDRIQFFDQGGDVREIEYVVGDTESGINDGWVIPSGADWEAKSV